MKMMRNSRSSLLRNERKEIVPSPRRWRALAYASIAAVFVVLLGVRSTTFAGSATWLASPANGHWSTAANWTAGGPPNGPSDTATFDVSTITRISISADTEVNGIVFDAGASAFTIAARSARTLTISGTGITNNSGIAQRFVANSLGTILFTGDSTGDTAQVQLLDSSSLDISTHNAPGVTVGSIEGTGTVNLGSNNLTVDSNYQNTEFSGVIQDSGAGGSLTKLGLRTLFLANANTYSGGTTISGGVLSVSNQTESATGSGGVNVVAGTLAGDGIIAGPVTVGTESGDGQPAKLSPGDNTSRLRGFLGTLTFLSTLTFESHAAYFFDVISAPDPTADQVIANGVTIRSRGADLFINDLGGSGALRDAELYDPGSGTWSATDSLADPRLSHTATLLPDGKVLVAGGELGFGLSLSSAELYNPATANWTPTGSLITARSFYTATLLLDGRVLASGGAQNFGDTATAELYDPTSGVWTATDQMADARELHTATLLQNGKVLVAGGLGLRSAELYDPATGTWFETGNPITSRWSHTATLLPDGRVLVAGGSTGIGNPTAKSELYDPATGTWAATGNLHAARQAHAAVLLPDGKVLVAGGQGIRATEHRTAELYDPASGTWMTTGSLAIPRSYFTATLLLNGKVMAAGGNNAINGTEPSVELYDPASGTWTTTASLDPGRYLHTATLLPDGTVLVAGGFGSGLLPGTVITVINNTSASPISGTFSNLPDGSIINLGGRNCQVSYSGGDGNDLTLTVLP